MILSDVEIRSALDRGLILIHPRPPEELWTSTAIDLTLDAVLLRWNPAGPEDDAPVPALRPNAPGFNVRAVLEDPRWTTRIPIPPEGCPLAPGQFVLGYTQQEIYLPRHSRIAARVEGKSSLARLGLGVHVTAPTIHAGFGDNPARPEAPGVPIQLEIFNLGVRTILLDVGMPICQLILEEVRSVPRKGYIGRFSEQSRFEAGEGPA